MPRFKKEQWYFCGLRGRKYWNDLCAEENSDGRRKYLHALVHSGTARRRLNSHRNLHRVPMRDCRGTAMLTRTNNAWNKNTGGKRIIHRTRFLLNRTVRVSGGLRDYSSLICGHAPGIIRSVPYLRESRITGVSDRRDKTWPNWNEIREVWNETRSVLPP